MQKYRGRHSIAVDQRVSLDCLLLVVFSASLFGRVDMGIIGLCVQHFFVPSLLRCSCMNSCGSAGSTTLFGGAKDTGTGMRSDVSRRFR